MTETQIIRVSAAREVRAPDQDLPAIELIGVAKEFHAHGEVVAAVKGIDLTIAPGEFFSMLGPSGCGKTTTMRMIAGFEEPTRGVVRLHGDDVTGVPPNKRDVNMVFQSYALFPHMTVFENVAFGLRRKRVGGWSWSGRVGRGGARPAEAEIAERVGSMLDIVDLAGLGRRRPRSLSGGQQQRVALARALVNHPSALLLDEPLGALDLKLRQAMQVELKRIQREVGITFVYVTHDQGEALTMSDRIAVMNDGAVEHLGTPREIYEHPRTKFVAGFIGTSNLLSGEVSRVDGDAAVIDLGSAGRIVIPVNGVPAQVGRPVELTVRPEKIEILAEQPATPRGSLLSGTVTEVIYLGTSTNYNIATSIGADVVVFTQNASSADDAAIRGDRVWLSWEPQHSYAIGAK
jgi:spermidine/putrescine ABC transporter ATP-binding subunit